MYCADKYNTKNEKEIRSNITSVDDLYYLQFLKKNIFLGRIIHNHEDNYTSISFLELSEENRLKINSFANKKFYFSNLNNIIRIYATGLEAYNNIAGLINSLSIQDFPLDFGYMTEEDFLIKVCKFYKMENNKKVLDKTLMHKDLKYYLTKTGYDIYYKNDEHRIYNNDYFLLKHNDYLNSLIKNKLKN